MDFYQENCIKTCPANQLEFQGITYKICISCPKKTHRLIEINGSEYCVPNCKGNDILGFNLKCIKPSKCTGLIHFNEKRCVSHCKNYEFSIIKADGIIYGCKSTCSIERF